MTRYGWEKQRGQKAGRWDARSGHRNRKVNHKTGADGNGLSRVSGWVCVLKAIGRTCWSIRGRPCPSGGEISGKRMQCACGCVCKEERTRRARRSDAERPSIRRDEGENAGGIRG